MAFSSFFRAFIWLIIGVVFGLASIILILASSSMFVQHGTSREVANAIDAEVIIFLCIALMSGAGADFLLSVKFGWGVRGFIFSIVVIFLFLAFFLLNPVNEPQKSVVNSFSVGYSIIAFVYCVSIKTVIFYEEILSKKRLRFR